MLSYEDDPHLKEIGEVPDILATSKVFWHKVFHPPLVAKYRHWSGLLLKILFLLLCPFLYFFLAQGVWVSCSRFSYFFGDTVGKVDMVEA